VMILLQAGADVNAEGAVSTIFKGLFV
jgi:hypothetical protein